MKIIRNVVWWTVMTAFVIDRWRAVKDFLVIFLEWIRDRTDWLVQILKG